MSSSTPPPSAPPRRVVFSGVKILVVEDHDDSREALVILLRSSGFFVQAASSLRGAIELVERSCPDVIVSDLGLPDGDGCDFIRHVRRGNDPARTIPALAVSAFQGPESQARAHQAGFNACVPKPLDLELLLRHLAMLLDGRGQAHASQRLAP